MVTPILAAILLLGALLGANAAAADPYLPPAHKLFAGVAGGPVAQYEREVGKHPAVYEVFSAWGEYLPGMFADAAAAHARLAITIQTASGSREMITPAALARGDGDGWLVALNQAMYASGQITYVRLMAEMDAYWNDYSASDANGRRAHDDL